MIHRTGYQSETLSNVLFFISHTFLKWNCVTVVFVVASGLGVAAFTSQVSEQPLPLGILNSVRLPGDAKIILKWAIRLKSSAINPQKMMDNVFY